MSRSSFQTGLARLSKLSLTPLALAGSGGPPKGGQILNPPTSLRSGGQILSGYGVRGTGYGVPEMNITALPATTDDIATLEELYRGLETEMVGLHPMWTRTDGLNEPVSVSFAEAIADPETVVLIGYLDDVPFGFLLARVEPMLRQSGDEKLGAIRLIYVDHPAREVAIGEVMRETLLTMLRARGITKFDAHVLPGHRLAKNFFESGGFSARSIIMHHDDDR